ncbi:MAG: asparagine synthase (glutamine-hydrolyzing) [Crocinitomicaceae bacterium]|nr:asparagine synthase (glutamine-hydrolyzing) [Crocinitomicaceae bacterium]
MCGITGYINLKEPVSKDIIQQMTDTLTHRGPDGEGIYVNEQQNLAFGHRRLSFLDLSEQGAQPMKDSSTQVVITFNGEIYNFLDLREDLKNSYSFKTNTDTEVILAAYKKWGIDCINHLKGMFAFALYDINLNKLFLIRDRFGIKPLYYTIQEGKCLFASELKAIHKVNLIPQKIDFSSFADYFVYRYIPSPKTIWEGVNKLPAAHYVEINLSDLSIQLKEYWKLNLNSLNNSPKTEVIKKTGELLKESIKEHIYADVPIGSFLSGGYDSSALVHYMRELDQKPNTFSIGFSKWEKSEDQYAKIVANHLGVENKSVIADEHSLNLVDKMAMVYDEPIADISIVPTFMVSQLAREKVKAVVSGEGADELFGGYTWQHDFFHRSYPSSFRSKVARFFKPKQHPVDFYAQAMAMGWFDKNELKKMLQPHLHSYIPDDVHWFYRQHFDKTATPLKSIQLMDIKCFMGELVLTKIDRASMANSLEVRVPFLNHKLFEYIFSLPEKQYFKPTQTKYLLYENIKNHLPTSILNRKKQGFVGPDAYYMDIDWYRTQLKNSKLVELNIVKQSYIDNLLKETYNWKLWKLLIMEKWVQKWM